MRIRDYTVSDADKVSSALFNQVTNDFSVAMVNAYMDVQELKRRNLAFKTAANSSMSYLIQQINGLGTEYTGLKVSGYNPPLSSSNIQLDHTYGQLSLAESNRTTHIPLLEDAYGRMLALTSVGLSSGKLETSFTANESMRAIIDGENELWMDTIAAADTDSGSIWIKLTTPLVGITPNFVSAYPLGGTTINEIKVKRSGGWTSFTPNSSWPVKYHQNFSDYENEVRIKITGVSDGAGNYVFIMRKIDLYTVKYASEGMFTYRTDETYSSISSVTLNSTYFYPTASQQVGSIKIQIYDITDTTLLYDSTRPSGAFSVPSGPDRVLVKGTLYRVSGSTPFMRSIT